MKKPRKATAKRKPAARKKPAAPKRKPVPRKKPAARPKAKPGKKTAPKKRGAGPIEGEVARVVAFFRIPVVAVLKVTEGPLKPGDQVWIRGHTTDLKQTIASMQVNHKPIPEAKKGMEVGVKVSSRVRRGDRVYRIS